MEEQQAQKSADMTVVDNRPSEMIQQAKELSTKIEKAEKKAKNRCKA